MSSEALSRDEAIGQFCGVTGANEDRAKALLEACDWNLELAINMHVDTDDGRNNKPQTSSSTSAVGPSTSHHQSSSSSSSSGPSRRLATVQSIRKDSSKQEAALIDDDDDDDIEIDQPINDHTLNGRFSHLQTARRGHGPANLNPRIQTARRSNNNSNPATTSSSNSNSSAGPSFTSPFCDPDNVRPPIPPIRQVLVNSDGYSSDLSQTARRYNTRTGAMSDVYDAFRDFQAETQWQEMAQAEGSEFSANDSAATNANKRTTLLDLFRPPLDVIFRGSLTTARDSGTQQNKWLLVNIQNKGEFACQALNRDVWSNQTVRDILKEHFIFWQVYHDSFEGSRYIQFYRVTSFPHISIIDPRTGEQMKSWPTSVNLQSFCESVIAFLTEHQTPDGSGDANTIKKLRFKQEDVEEGEKNVAPTLYDQSEEAQLEAAIKASLQENTENSNSSRHTFVDEDSYTDTIESDNEQTRDGQHTHSMSSNNDNNYNTCSTGSSSSSSNNKQHLHRLLEDSSSSSSNNNNNKQQQQQISIKEEKPDVALEDYKKYLGVDKEKFSDLVVRFPDGTRDQFKFPSDSMMKALFLLLTSRGYGIDQYNYVTTFPRRLLHELPSTETLQEAKLIRETIFVERRIKSKQQ